DLVVPAPRRWQRDTDADEREQRAEHAEANRIQRLADRRAEEKVHACDREHENERDQAGQARARQRLPDVKIAKLALEQRTEAQRPKAALELVRERRPESLGV